MLMRCDGCKVTVCSRRIVVCPSDGDLHAARVGDLVILDVSSRREVERTVEGQHDGGRHRVDAEALERERMRGPSVVTAGGGRAAAAEATAVLLAVDGSDSVADTDAEAVSVPAAVGRTTMMNVWRTPLARLPSGKVSLPLLGVRPPVAEMNVAAAGSVSVSAAFEAESGPWLVTVMVKVTSFWPTVAVAGEADCVTTRSAAAGGGVVGAATVVVAESESLSESLSIDGPVEIEAESTIVEPSVAAESTRTTRVNAAWAWLSSAPAVAETAPVPPAAGVLGAQPAGAVNETKVVPAGTSFVRPAPEAASGPSLVTVIVYVKNAPGAIGSGVAETVTPTSAIAGAATCTVVVVSSELLAPSGSSVVPLATEAEPEILEPSVDAPFTVTTNVNVSGDPAPAKLAVVATTEPEPPTAGAVTFQPEGGVNEANVVPAGTGTVSETCWPASGRCW